MKTPNKSDGEQKVPVAAAPIDLETPENGSPTNGSEPPARIIVENTAVNGQSDEAALDEFERLAADTILEDDDGDEPSAKETLK